MQCPCCLVKGNPALQQFRALECHTHGVCNTLMADHEYPENGVHAELPVLRGLQHVVTRRVVLRDGVKHAACFVWRGVENWQLVDTAVEKISHCSATLHKSPEQRLNLSRS